MSMRQVIGEHDPLTGSLDVMLDGTLFKSEYLPDRAQYRITSRSPVEERELLFLVHIVERIDATRYRESNFIKGYSIDSAALKLGIEELQLRIPIEMRKLREGELVAAELEELEGYGSF